MACCYWQCLTTFPCICSICISCAVQGVISEKALQNHLCISCARVGRFGGGGIGKYFASLNSFRTYTCLQGLLESEAHLTLVLDATFTWQERHL